jgi:hypothetical protein
MLHKFFEEGYWFAPKKFGYGAGLPTAWQGWALLIGYVLMIAGLAAFARQIGLVVFMASAILLTIPLMIVARRRT